MNKSKLYITFGLIFIVSLVVLITAVFYPAESRKEEIARAKEIEITDKFISGYTLSDEEIVYLRQRSFKYLISAIQSIYYKDKGAGYDLYKKAINIGVQSQNIYAGLAQLYINRNEKDKAITLYEKAIEIDPKIKNWNTKEYIGKLAELYHSTGDFYRSAKYYEQNLKYYPRNIGNIYYLAFCYVNMEEPDKALNELNKAVRIDPGSKYLTDIYNLMGIVYENKGMLGEAERYYSEALRINPKNKKAAANITRLQKKLKEQKT